jgi:hypothetical protein
MRGEWDISIRRAGRVFMLDTSSYHYKSRRPGQAALKAALQNPTSGRLLCRSLSFEEGGRSGIAREIDDAFFYIFGFLDLAQGAGTGFNDRFCRSSSGQSCAKR